MPKIVVFKNMAPNVWEIINKKALVLNGMKKDLFMK